MSSVSGANAAGYRFNAAALFTKNDVLLSIVFIARRDDSHIAPSVGRCEKLASGRPGRRNRLPHLSCCAKVCKLGGAGGFACRANFSHLLSAGTGLLAKPSPR